MNDVESVKEVDGAELVVKKGYDVLLLYFRVWHAVEEFLEV